jgi:hypothetical protein
MIFLLFFEVWSNLVSLLSFLLADPLLALLAGAALVSHVSGMYHTRHDPVELALGLCSMLITLAAVFTVEQMKNKLHF